MPIPGELSSTLLDAAGLMRVGSAPTSTAPSTRVGVTAEVHLPRGFYLHEPP